MCVFGEREREDRGGFKKKGEGRWKMAVAVASRESQRKKEGKRKERKKKMIKKIIIYDFYIGLKFDQLRTGPKNYRK